MEERSKNATPISFVMKRMAETAENACCIIKATTPV